MTVRFIINFVLLAVPIGITLGVLMGIDQSRKASGQDTLYSPDDGDGNGSGKPPKKGNGFTTETFCNKTYGYTPYTAGQEYTLNPNQWGWDEGDSGNLCLTVKSNNNGSYATKTTAPKFSITWQYPTGPETQPVHAFPNIKVDGDVFPAKLSKVSSIDVDFKWTYGVGNSASSDTDVDTLDAAEVNTNVAMDMFFDTDKTSATNASKASHEVMVWFAAFGSATQPLGLTIDDERQDSLANMTIDKTNFGLYKDTNSEDQIVLTWMSSGTADEFTGDIYPLIEKLFKMDGDDYPDSSYYIGYMSWGTEAYSSSKNVTFSVPKLSIDVETS